MVSSGPASESASDIMIDEPPDFREVLVCVFDISDHEARTYLLLLDNPGSTVEELSAPLDRDRSNVNRTLATLQEKGLASREIKILPEGGNVYQYTATPLSEAQVLMHDTLDEWTDYVHTCIDQFGNDDF